MNLPSSAAAENGNGSPRCLADPASLDRSIVRRELPS
jgi:hypothetical protein